jgi:hypothetical protein
MSDNAYEYKEIRFLIEDELTQCYVFLASDFEMAHGWRHRTFPARIPIEEIVKKHVHNAITWSTGAPP